MFNMGQIFFVYGMLDDCESGGNVILNVRREVSNSMSLLTT